MALTVNVVEEIDFDSDDSIADPTYKLVDNRKRASSNILYDDEQGMGSEPKKMKLDEDAGRKLLFCGKFFGQVNQFNDQKSGISAVCQLCKKTIKGSLSVTSNFIKHLKRIHSDSYEEYTSMRKKSSSDINNPSTSGEAKSFQQEFDKLLISFIVDTASPVSIVERKSFVNLLLFQRTGLSVSSRPRVMKLLDAQYKNMVTKIKTTMSSVKYFCTTADIWSTRHRSFLGYTCHWIDEDFNRISVALACKRFCGIHSADRIADMISDINSSYNLKHLNVVATVTDNSSNFVKAFKEFGITSISNLEVADENETYECLSDDDEIPTCEAIESSAALPKHLRCASHTLNLLATTDFLKLVKNDKTLHSRHLQAIEKCNNLWKKSRWPKSSEVIQNTLGSLLLIPVVTRWNSLYDAVGRILQHKEKMNDLCTKLSVPRFSQNDMQYLQEYCILMEPLAATLDFLQQDQNLIYGYFLPALVTLKTKFRKIVLSEKLKLLNSIAVQLEENLVRRFRQFFHLESESDDAIVAAILCPSIKKKWVSPLNSETQYRSAEEINRLILKYAKELAESEGESLEISEEDSSGQETFFDFDNMC